MSPSNSTLVTKGHACPTFLLIFFSPLLVCTNYSSLFLLSKSSLSFIYNICRTESQQTANPATKYMHRPHPYFISFRSSFFLFFLLALLCCLFLSGVYAVFSLSFIFFRLLFTRELLGERTPSLCRDHAVQSSCREHFFGQQQ